MLEKNNIEFKTYKDQCVFEKDEVTKDDGRPYTVFTPYANKWKKKLKPFYYKAYPTKKYFKNFAKIKPEEIPTLKKIGFTKTDIVLNKKYDGQNPDDRPDLLFARTLSKQLFLIEFKRPSFTLTRDTENQAIKYRDDLNTYFHNQKIEILLLGGRVKEAISSHNERQDVNYRTYIDIISVARQKLEWLINELKTN